MLIAGPNLTIDRTLTIPALRPGEVLRFDDVAVTPGGKGVNVARVAQALGAPALLVGFTPGHTGEACARMLADEGVALRAVPASGELRSTAVVLEHGGRVTVFNEPGPRIDDGDWARYVAAVADALGGHRVLACSGSAPPGTPPGAYAELAALARSRSVVAIVDATGPLLAEAVAGGAELVTPNPGEAESLLHVRAAVAAGLATGAASVETAKAGAIDPARAAELAETAAAPEAL